MAQRHGAPSPITYFTDYARRSADDENTLEIPEDLGELSTEDLSELHDQAVEAFNALRDGEVTDESIEQMEQIADGIDALRAEQDVRAQAASERLARAEEISSRVNPADPADEAGDDPDNAQEGDEEGEDEASDEADEQDEDNPPADEPSAEADGEVDASADLEAVAASGTPKRKAVRVKLSGLSSRHSTGSPRPANKAKTMRDLVMAAPDVPGFSSGQGMNFLDMGRAVDARLQNFQVQQYTNANRAGRHLRQQFGVAVIRKPYEDDLRITSNDPEHIEKVFSRAVDETRLPGGSLVASGGWCAPSEIMYDLFELESRDGLFSMPEVNISRGGIQFTQGPDFASLFAEITGFHYTEAQDEAGTYGVDVNGTGDGTAGSKPCYKVECPDFQEVRLDLDGLCITAGLLQQRGYPEVIARTLRGALVAHDHRLAGRKLASLEAQSTAIAMPGSQVGATAPLLQAIDLQVEHYRQTHRMSRSATLEAVFPLWVHGAVRADLSRRLGIDLLDVNNARINGWFSARGINPQFVYNWDDLTTTATGTTGYPADVKFLLYAAGTFVGGGSDVITVDTLYDSTLLGDNDYTALFTEEGWLIAKRGHDSRVITVPICPDGATSAGVAIACNGTETV